MWERTTALVRCALEEAKETRAVGSDLISTERLLFALLSRKNIATTLLEELNIGVENLLTGLAALIEHNPSNDLPVSNTSPGHPPAAGLSTASLRACTHAHNFANGFPGRVVDEGCLLVGLLATGPTPAADALTASGADLDRVIGSYSSLFAGCATNQPANGFTDTAEREVVHALDAMEHEDASAREAGMELLYTLTRRFGSDVNRDGRRPSQALREHRTMRTQFLRRPRVTKSLLVAMHDPSARVRTMAATLLGESRIKVSQAVLIPALLRDPVERVRLACALALSKSPSTKSKTAAMVAALGDSSCNVITTACQSLWRCRSRSVVNALRAQLKNSDWHVRFAAAEALVRADASDHALTRELQSIVSSTEAVHYDRQIDIAINRAKPYMTAREYRAAKARHTYVVYESARRLAQ